eukprot:TRINITY_DN6000_c0_g2_i1.p1 TRINITY_DN6000_c0_g2~~TRINITY_DN6000_c0_g2_i1.p1  ORF type:complete len:350 (-),score=58.85 TRINITY_DN6000_c0_g2_i1:57-1106(-)
MLPYKPGSVIVKRKELSTGGLYLYTATTTYFVAPVVLGTGSFSTVKLGYYHTSEINSEVKKTAVKIIPKSNLTPTRVKAVAKEIKVLEKLTDEADLSGRVIQLIDYLEDEDYIYIMCDPHDGDLYTYYSNRSRLTESEVILLFPQMVEAVSFCHSNGVVHRDIKLENFLFNAQYINGIPYLRVILADFGFSTFFESSNDRFHKWCGSTYTVAPEILQRIPYKPEPVDVWALGCVLFSLLCGRPPFKGRNAQSTFEKTMRGQMRSFPSDLGESIQDLIRKMLTLDPAHRISLGEVKQHPWFRLAVGVQKRFSLGRTIVKDYDVDDFKAVREAREIAKEKRRRKKEKGEKK